ncbi:MAG: transcriptional regulator [Alphaproteobacteria bacterium]|nr:MAG: transcriptional regulator [Alphaproteobacteria bacterium]
MPFTIDDPRAVDLARDLAALRGTTITQAVIAALEAETQRERAAKPLAASLLAIADELQARSRPGGHRMTPEEIDELWGP